MKFNLKYMHQLRIKEFKLNLSSYHKRRKFRSSSTMNVCAVRHCKDIKISGNPNYRKCV